MGTLNTPQVPQNKPGTLSTPSPKEKLFIPFQLQTVTIVQANREQYRKKRKKKNPHREEVDRGTQRAMTVIGTLEEKEGNQL